MDGGGQPFGALGRVVSGAVDRPTRFYPVSFYCCVEIVAAAGMLPGAASG
ncbi:hypothetical protein [Saccharopolyspora pogona]|nr:hypothetical protein [Saccharopolyspora pogona]